MNSNRATAFVYGVGAGRGGLGLQAATALTALAADGSRVHAFGPGRVSPWPLPGAEPDVTWHESPRFIPEWAYRYTWWRWYQGSYQLEWDRRLGAWAAGGVERLRPGRCYVFTQVGLETLRWARANGVRCVLDNPNGHIRHYREVFQEESRRWCGGAHIGHPTEAAVERVEEEYELASSIRVSSEWAKRSMVSRGVPAEKVQVIAQPLNLSRFTAGPEPKPADGPLRLCYVGNLNLAKGFLYLLRALRAFGAGDAALEIVGATGSRHSRLLFERESRGLVVKSAPGDPLPAYRRAEVFVFPSLHDGFGFAPAEAMACGLPVIITEDCGAAGWVRDGETGWVIPPRDVDAVTLALGEAARRRAELPGMGARARAEVERRGSLARLAELREWFYSGGGASTA
ncbi:MAG: glycosyltransferase family 4 protein [Pyrinomonadaceae bacterium]